MQGIYTHSNPNPHDNNVVPTSVTPRTNRNDVDQRIEDNWSPRIDPPLSNHRSGVMHGVPPSPEGCVVPFCFFTVFYLAPSRHVSPHSSQRISFLNNIHYSTFFFLPSINLVHTRLVLFQSLTLFPLSFSYGLVLVSTSIKMRSSALSVAVVLLLALHLVHGQTYTVCNPLSSSKHIFLHHRVR
jgi:hypothetical protein